MISPRLQDFLQQRGADYTHTQHPLAYTAREVAHAEHVPPYEVAKTVVFVTDNGYSMAVVPGNRVLDLQELRAILGVQHLRLATEAELAQLFPDVELGAMPPFGTLYGMPVYVDSGLADQEEIVFNGGTHRDTIHMKFAEFQKLAEPMIVSFARVH